MSANFYLVNEDTYSSFPLVDINEYATLERGTTITKKTAVTEGTIPVVGGGQAPSYFHDTANRVGPTITVSSSGAYAGFINYYQEDIFASDCFTIKPNELLNIKYLFRVLKYNQQNIFNLATGAAQPHVYAKDFNNFKIPLPPFEKQQEIVDEIEQYQKVIDGARQVIENYKPSFHIEEGAKFIELGSVVEISRGGSPRPIKQFLSETDGENWIKIKDGSNSSKYIEHTKEKISKEGTKHSRMVNKGDLILSNSMSFGKPYILKIDGYIHDGWLSIKFDDKKYDVDYLYYLLSSKFIMEQFKNVATGSTVNNLNKQLVSKVLIPDYPLKKQQKIAEKLEEERDVIIMNTKIIKNFEEKIDELVSNLYKET